MLKPLTDKLITPRFSGLIHRVWKPGPGLESGSVLAKPRLMEWVGVW